jgi:hypothetical protein
MIERLLGHGYLRDGTPRQRAAGAALRRLDLFARLAPFTPVLAGTIPLAVDTPASDLDVLCEAHDLDAFEAGARAAFGQHAGFRVHRAEHQGLPAAIVCFATEGFPFELFGQPRSVGEQRGFLHLVAEARLLACAEGQARAAIRALKLAGLKTEPAFAVHFALAGDPYVELVRLATAPDAELAAIAARRHRDGR